MSSNPSPYDRARLILAEYARKPTVYLAGPIVGLTYEEAATWRLRATKYLSPGVTTLDPMRGKLAWYDEATKTYPLYPRNKIVADDLDDIRRSDAILVNLMQPSTYVGTLMELGVALERKIPVFAYARPGGYIDMNHPFIQSVIASYSTYTSLVLNHILAYFGKEGGLSAE